MNRLSNKRKNNRLFTAMCLSAALLVGGCTQNELADTDGTDLPDGKYPLQIASVSVTAESTAEPWGANAPQTRVSESEDGKSSAWENGDLITVQIGDDATSTGTYRVNVDASGKVTGLTTKTALYWKNTTAQKLKGWYPADITNDISLNNQGVNGAGLAYALYAETANTVDYQTQTPIELPFNHQLAKARVVLEGSGKDEVKEVKVYTYPTCKFTPNDATTKIAGSGTPEYIPMKETIYNNGTTCWEANVVPGYEINKVKVNKTECTLTTSIVPEAAILHVVKIDVKKGPEQIDLSKGDYTITDDGEYIVSGTFSNKTITINGSPTITLNGINITHTGTIIEIKSGSPVFVLNGENKLTVETDRKTFIQLSGENTNLTIRGNGTLKLYDSRDDSEATLIGSPNCGKCGNIIIEDCTIIAETISAAAIGAAQGGTCGNITIKNATINAKGSPAIGASQVGGNGAFQSHCDNILIENSNLILSTKRYYGESSVAIGAGSIDVSDASTSCGTITITNTSKTCSQILSTITGENLKIGKSVVTGNNSSNSCGLITITGSDGMEIYSGDSGVPN